MVEVFSGRIDIISDGHTLAEGPSVAAAGNLYFVDSWAGRFFRVDDDGETRLFAELEGPNGTAFHWNGDIYVADPGGERIARVTQGGKGYTVATTCDGQPLEGTPNNITFTPRAPSTSPLRRIRWRTAIAARCIASTPPVRQRRSSTGCNIPTASTSMPTAPSCTSPRVAPAKSRSATSAPTGQQGAWFRTVPPICFLHDTSETGPLVVRIARLATRTPGRIRGINLSYLPLIGLTLGDPTGVGPEVVAKTLTHREIYEKCRPLAIGSSSALQRIINICGLGQQVRNVDSVEDATFEFGVIDVLDPWGVDHSDLIFKEPTAEGGAAAATAVIEAVKLAYAGKIDGLATAPLHKVAMKMAGFDYPGHTEIVGEFSESPDPRMMLVAGSLRVIHVSTHVSLREAVDLVKTPRILEAIEILHQALQDLGIEKPTIAVAGLNPHAEVGDHFGPEDSHEVAPAVEQACAAGIDAQGPLPPDTVFSRAAGGEYDGVVAMYHDQGHIPVKMLGIHEGVNVTLNTNVIRASVDHGTAYGRAGDNRADETSMRLSMLVAIDMINARRARESAAG